MQRVYKDTETKGKQKTKEEHPKKPKDRRKATLNPQPLASNPARTNTPNIEIDQAF